MVHPNYQPLLSDYDLVKQTRIASVQRNSQPGRSATWLLFVLGFIVVWGALPVSAQDESANRGKLRAVLVDGQNNHSIWPKTSEMMRWYLIDSGRFQVELVRTAPTGIDETFQPDFSKYDVVISNYNGADWPQTAKTRLENFVSEGGGLVVIHAADNAFPEWPEWNRMIGLGGWGGRNANSGPYVYFDPADRKLIRDTSAGDGGSHGSQHQFLVETRQADHPIMKGLPAVWLHTQDELYDRLRGPAENMQVLATAFADPKQGGSGRHEPMVMVVEYGKGRVFHTTLGHADYSQECVGFITLLLRGAEWAATGEVTFPIPADFPTADKTSQRTFSESESKSR